MFEKRKEFVFSKKYLPELEEMKKELNIKDDKTLFNTALELLQKKIQAEKDGLEIAIIDRNKKEFYPL